MRPVVPVYFAEARSPWQRGSNENTTGLLGEYPQGHRSSTALRE